MRNCGTYCSDMYSSSQLSKSAYGQYIHLSMSIFISKCIHTLFLTFFLHIHIYRSAKIHRLLSKRQHVVF